MDIFSSPLSDTSHRLTPVPVEDVQDRPENSDISILYPVENVTHTSGVLPGTPDGGSVPMELSYLRQEPWVIPLLAASATNTAAIIVFEMYIVVRAVHGTPSRRHLFLGQCLMIGLLLSSLSGLPLSMQPSTLTCATSRIMIGSSTALVFAALLVKCVFLISLNSGVYLPAHYQALLLFFIMLVQISLGVQWLWWSPAKVIIIKDVTTGVLVSSCQASYRQFLLSLLYVMFLIVSVAALAVKCRGIRENYRESSYIGASLCLVLPLWLAWSLAGLVLPPRLQPACLGFGIVATAIIVFVIMFVPKGRQLAAAGKEGLYREDRDDHMSTASGARYSPSFFLFKPIKSSKEFLRPPADLIRSPKEVLRPSNSIYKTHLSDMFGYGALPPLPPQPAPIAIPPAPIHAPPPPMWYYQHYYNPGATSRTDEGIYTTIERSPADYSISSNPNFYLFRSHAHPGMMY